MRILRSAHAPVKMRIRIQNARIVDARGERTGDVVVEDSLFSGDMSSACDRVVSANGLVLMPALIDTHCHLRDPGWPEKETMESGMHAALKGGYGTLCAMANTKPVCETAQQVVRNLEKSKELKLCRLIQAAAAGIDLSDTISTDYASLSKVTRIISNDGKTIQSDAFMEQLLLASQQYGFLVSTHCQPERATVRRDLALLRRTAGHLHVGHISCRETVAMIREAKASGLPVTCEVMPHHLFGWDNPYKVNPPMRTKDDAMALLEGICDGTVDCLATDHAPHTAADKAGGAAGISNIEHALAIFWKVFYDNGIPLTKLSELTAYHPARLLNTGSGLIASGEPADCILFDPNEEWRIRKDQMISRSNNTPFDGRMVRGRVYKTIIGGEIRYEYDGSTGA